MPNRYASIAPAVGRDAGLNRALELLHADPRRELYEVGDPRTNYTTGTGMFAVSYMDGYRSPLVTKRSLEPLIQRGFLKQKYSTAEAYCLAV